MDFVNNILETIIDIMYSYLLVYVLIFAGLFFSFKSRFVQFRLLMEGIYHLKDKNENENAVSSFQALMISTASRVGVGNIAGVATAIAVGGAGSIFWMWVMALVGAASAFIESTLAQIYKEKDGANKFIGGPSYYIERALKNRGLGIVFSIFLIICFAYGFNGLQANNIVSSISYYWGGEFTTNVMPIIIGVILSVLTAYVVFGGQKKIAFITSVIVPIMAVLYLIIALFIVAKNISVIPAVFSEIFRSAFDFKAILGGFSGSAVLIGVKRGLFSNEAGMGSAPNAAASAHVTHPVKQGLVQMISVFIDTLILCTASAFIVLCSGVDTTGIKAMTIIQHAINSQLGIVGIHFITISIFFFAFSSIIGNYFYTESNMLYITKGKSDLKLFRCTVILAVFLGSIAGYDLVWNFADVTMGFMAIINIVVIVILNKIPLAALEDYEKQSKEGIDPVFKAKNIGLDNTDLWK
ncbi:MAG: alanine/glycine:cation symporter family protein [Anaerotignaceae bacterium]